MNGVPDCASPRLVDQRAAVWVIGAGEWLQGQLQELLRPFGREIREVRCNPDAKSGSLTAASRGAPPDLIVLDIGKNPEWGEAMIQRIRRERIESPIVVFTCEVSREFGAKILSQGIGYYFTHEFSQSEFQEVAGNLLARQI